MRPPFAFAGERQRPCAAAVCRAAAACYKPSMLGSPYNLWPLLVTASALATAPFAAAAQALRRAVTEELEDDGYQTAMPGQPEPLEPGQTSPAEPPPMPDPFDPIDIGPFMELLLYALVGGAAVLLVLFLAQEGRRYLRQRQPKGEAKPRAPADPGEDAWAAGSVDMLRAAERHAAAGDHATAIHLLLLHAIDGLRRQGAVFGRALTSREILYWPGLAAPARDALARIVAAVEISRFGGRAAGAEDYRACVEAYRRFVAGLTAAHRPSAGRSA